LTSASTSQNQLLAALPEHCLSRLQPYLEPFSLPVREVLERPDEPISHVVFPLCGVSSIVAGTADDRVEVGMIGRDGMVGISVLHGVTASPYECFVQIAGHGLRMSTDRLEQALDEDRDLHRHLLHYAHSFMVQLSQTALANGRYTIDERLARWLVMSQDRLDGQDVPLTHEFLSLMLGVRRPGVTDALHRLEGAQLIRNSRGCVTILDRLRLIEIAGIAYRALA
jgi:CRP-like cAMP-binding protein